MHEVYTRAARIVGDGSDDEPIDDALLVEPAERQLAEAVRPSRTLERPKALLDWAIGWRLWSRSSSTTCS